MGDASKRGERAANGAQEQVLVMGERVFRENQSAVERDVDGLDELERSVIGIRESDKNS